MRVRFKLFWIIISLLLIVIAALFLTLPLQSNVHEEMRFKSNSNALMRQLVRDTSWHNWWPGKVETSKGGLKLNQSEFTFTIKKIYLNKIEFQISSGSFESEGTLQVITESTTDVLVSFYSIIDLDTNPFKRIKSIFLSSKLKSAFKTILASQTNYFSTVKHLYDIDIKESTVQYEFYATLSQAFTYEPTIAEQYEMIARVKDHIKKNKASELGVPMLNITKISDKEYQTQVAIPTETQLPPSNGIKSKWMLKGGHILKAKVYGGRDALLNAKEQMHNYIMDQRKTTVAIHYEYLITDRSKETDSRKWVTELYFPVI